MNTLVIRTGKPDYVQLTTNLGLKHKRRMLYFLMDFDELTLDDLVDTEVLSSAIPEADLRKIRSLAFQSIIKEGPAPNFQIMVANWQLETPKSTVELKFEVGDIDFHEIFITHQSFDWSFVPPTEQQHSGHETRSPEFHFFFKAIKNCRSQTHQRYGAHLH